MSTNDVPGTKHADVLAMGCWAEHDDGSLIYIDGVEAGSVVYSIFDVGVDPPVEYRDAMPEDGFKRQFSWRPDDPSSVRWTWHDKTPMPWARVMRDFGSGQRHVSARETLNAAQLVAQSLRLRAEGVRERHAARPTPQRAASTIMRGVKDLIDSLRP